MGIEMEIRDFKNYKELKATHQKEMNEFPLGAAFSNEQFKEMMEKWGLTENDTDKIYSIGCGCFIRKSDSQRFHDLMERFELEEKAFRKKKKNAIDQFYYELGNHEYCITHDLEPTLNACGITLEEFEKDDFLKECMNKARIKYKKAMLKYGY